MFRGLKALIVGLLAGTALGVIFAPKKGEELRKSFKKELDGGGYGLDTLKDAVTELGKDLGSAGKDFYDELSENEHFQKAEKELKKHATKAKKEAQKLYKKKVPAETRRKAKKAYVEAKKAAQKAAEKAKETADKVAKKVAEKKSKK